VQVGSQNNIFTCGEFSPFWKKKEKKEETQQHQQRVICF
jgi:hypothetical protein